MASTLPSLQKTHLSNSCFYLSNSLVTYDLSYFYKKLGEHASELLSELLKMLAELHLDAKSHHSLLLQKAIESCFLAFLVHSGPQNFLKILPLNLFHKDLSLNRAFLLPLLEKGIYMNFHKKELKFFGQYFIPLDTEILKRIEECVGEEKHHEAKNYEILHLQVWSLFPSFCSHPRDIDQVDLFSSYFTFFLF